MKKVIVIAGVTGSGKTSLSIDLAKKYQGEIINADSVSIYKDLNIGSAKISKEDQAGIPHHLLDVLEIEESYSVADFQKDARMLVDEIIERGNVPIIVGGTGLYINAVIYDYHFKEKKLKEIDTNLSNQELKDMLDKLDPESSKKVHINNRKRLIRSVQMAKTFGKTKSEINNSNKDKKYYNAEVFFLQGEREKIYSRINNRVDRMFKEGLVQEVSELYKKKPKIFAYKSLNSIGYREFEDYFLGNISLEECKDLVKRNTRRLAKRQITWFKHQTKSIRVDIFDEESLVNINKRIENFLKS